MKRLSLLLIGCAALVLMAASKCNNEKAPADAAVVPPVVAEQPAPPPAPVAADVPKLLTPDKEAKNAKVKITTPFGVMTVKLYDETPWHRDNFLQLVDMKYYDNLLWHRCIKGFMIQGGDPDSRNAAPEKQLGMGSPGYKVPAEFNASLIHKKGALAAARQGGPINPNRESSGSQFYIVQGTVHNDMQLAQMETMVAGKMPGFKYTEEQKKLYKSIGGTAQLDMDYTVFGEVIEGLNIIDSINAQPTRAGDRPLKNITMMMERVK